jgi:NAD(P)-dependent dehydrogenase (short-subunit alcohol dehydrogenase family)
MTAPSKAVLVTGCSSGIGRATAERLAKNGWTVYASARKPDTIADLGAAGCKLLACDVSNEDSMRGAVAEVEAAEGAVGALVNNAGFGLEGPVEEVPIDEWRRQFETNVFGMVRLIQLVLPKMREQRWGRIVNVSSIGGRLVFPGGAPYHASKWAVEALSDALRYEVKPFGVRVSIVEPGIIRTKFGETAVATVTEHGGDGPYAVLSKSVADRTAGAYEGPMAMMSAGPESVARVIERAIKRRSPRPRYRVTAGGRMILVTRASLTDRAWDRMMRLAYKPPKPD